MDWHCPVHHLFCLTPSINKSLGLEQVPFMRRSLNVRFAVIALGGAAVLLLACHTIHSLQVRRYAWALLDEAQRAEARGQLQLAAAYLGDYLTFIPEDTEALARYGLTLERLT